MTLQWEQAGRWWIRSLCGRYTVAKAMVGERATYLPYLAASGEKYGPRSSILGDVKYSAAGAMAVCQAHADQQSQEGAER